MYLSFIDYINFNLFFVDMVEGDISIIFLNVVFVFNNFFDNFYMI